MQRIVTVVERNEGISAVTADRQAIDCDDDFSGIDGLVAQSKLAGADMVLVLLEDDSLIRHWTRPEA